MLVTSQSATGSIRENNQDRVFINKEARLVVLFDGIGPEGANASARSCRLAAENLLPLAHLYSAEDAPEKLKQALVAARQEVYEKFPDSLSGFCAIWIHRQTIALAWFGTCKIVFPKLLSRRRDFSKSDIQTTSLPASPNQRFLLVSEGLNTIFSDRYLHNLCENLFLDYSNEQLQFFWNEASQRYDGDDRTLINVCLDKSDLTAGNPKEILLFTDIDRQFSIPLWLPASFLAAFGMIGLFLARKAFLLLKRFQPEISEKIELLPLIYRYIK